MNIADVIRRLDGMIPESIALAWDNSGFLIGHEDREASRVLVCVDVTDGAVKRAAEAGAQLIVAHHPLIFKGMKSMTDRDAAGRRVLSLIEQGIAVYAMHTDYDCAADGMGLRAAAAMGLSDIRFLADEFAYGEGEKGGLGAVGSLAEELTGEEFVALVKAAFAIPHAVVYGNLETKISRAGICPGSGKEYWRQAKAAGAQAYVTGDLSHHEGLDAAAEGLLVVDAGHYGVEKLFVADAAARLTDIAEGAFDVISYYEEPFTIL